MGLFRLLLALWVVFNHGEALFGRLVPQSWAAVQCFFIISGFYMSLILNEKYTGPGSVRLFFRNRFLRLFPAYWVVLLLVLAVYGAAAVVWHRPLGAVETWQTHRALLGAHNVPMLAAANAFVFGQNEVMYLAMDGTTGALSWTTNFEASNPKVWHFLVIPQAWSIELEVLFYCLAPWIVRRSLKAVLAIMAASFAVRAGVYLSGLTFDPWTYRFFPNELGVFLLGTVAYRIYRAPWRDRVGTPAVVGALTALLFAATIAFPWITALPGQVKAWPYFALATVTVPFLFARTKALKWDRWIGELSYPVYLVHYMVVHVCAATLPTPLRPHLSLVAGAASVALAVVLMKCVLEPIERIRQAPR